MADILRYPYEAITNTTDYLQIDISAYVPAGTTYIRDRTEPGNSLTFNPTPVSGITKDKLYQDALTNNQGTILLPIPSNIQDSNNVLYAEDSMNKLVADLTTNVNNAMNIDTSKDIGKQVLDVTGGFATLLANPEVKATVLRSLAAQAVNVFGGNVSPDSLLARSTGNIFNPNMELLFSGVTLRTFKFSFKMTPRNENEAKQCKLIIRSFKQNMAPSVGVGASSTSSTGVTVQPTYLKTPNVFNLTYKKGADTHPFLNKFKQCALQDMSVNYTGENVYATYPKGEPISMVMDLTFKELEPIYSSDYDNIEGVGY